MTCRAAAVWVGVWATVLVHSAVAQTPPAKFEPSTGCYLGAFIERDPECSRNGVGDIAKFEKLTDKRHACYVTYSGYGRPFPAEFVDRLSRHGAAAHIAWEPNDGLDAVRDDAYLRGWAKAAARAGLPIFLRFAAEMNGGWTRYSGHPSEFIDKWRLVARVMREEAPNVAMVWCVFPYPQHSIASYYPGDDSVDWVGINLYSLMYHNNNPMQPAGNKDPREELRFFYDRYSVRKPVMICEYAATSFCRVVNRPTVSFALDKMTTLYANLAREFPRVKAINWFSLDARGVRNASNNYSVTWNDELVSGYRRLVSNGHYLSRVSNGSYVPRPLPPLPPVMTQGLSPLPAAVLPAARLASAPVLGLPSSAPRLELEEPEETSRSEYGLVGLRSGAVVRGQVSLTAHLPSSCRPRYVGYRLDGRSLGISNQAPFSLVWNSETVAPGRYRLTYHVYLGGEAAPIVSAPIDIEVRR